MAAVLPTPSNSVDQVPAATEVGPEDMLATLINQLNASLHPIPPASYRARFIAQTAITGLLLLLCIVYIACSILDARLTGRPLRLAKLQQVAGGRIITLNSLFLLVVFMGLHAALGLLMRWKVHDILYSGGSQFNQVAIQVAGYTPLVLSAWSYCVGIIAGMMQLRKRDLGGPSRALVAFYNAAFFGTPFAWFTASIPLMVIANSKTNKAVRIAEHGLSLALALMDPTGLDLDKQLSAIVELQDLAPLIQTAGEDAIPYQKSVSLLAVGMALLTIFTLIATFSFVRFLVMQSNWDLQRHTRIEEEEAKTLCEPAGESKPGVPTFRMPPLASLSKRPHQLSAGTRAMNAALQRLAKDLTVSVPIIITIALYLTVISFFVNAHLGQTAFKWIELNNDGVSWTSVPLTIIVACFLAHMWLYPTNNQSSAQSMSRKRSMSTKGRVTVAGSCDAEGGSEATCKEDGLAFSTEKSFKPREAPASQTVTFEIVTATKIDEVDEELLELPTMERKGSDLSMIHLANV